MEIRPGVPRSQGRRARLHQEHQTLRRHEVFVDKHNGQWLAVSEVGNLATLRTPTAPGPKDNPPPKWLHGLELKCRKAGENDFTKDTKRYGLEVFKDENTGQLIYICETGSIATVPAGTASTPAEPKAPTFVHGLELKCRKGGEIDFTPATKKFGLEVFKDENTGNLVYITETGMIAVIPGSGITPPAKVKGPTWLHGLEFRVRKANEPDFTKDTQLRREIFRDENTNQAGLRHRGRRDRRGAGHLGLE